MAASKLLRPASRYLSTPLTSPLTALPRSSVLRPLQASTPILPRRRTYASEAGSKDYAVRDALNEAMAEELERNEKVFILGEWVLPALIRRLYAKLLVFREVAQYNGAYVLSLTVPKRT